MASVLSSNSINLKLQDAVSCDNRVRYLSAPNYRYNISKSVSSAPPNFHSMKNGVSVSALVESNNDLGSHSSCFFPNDENNTTVESPIPSSTVLTYFSLNSACPSTMFLHKHDRPSLLPEKDPSEAEHHQKQFDRIMLQVKKRQNEEIRRIVTEKEIKEATEKKTENLLQFWRSTVLPNWTSVYQSSRVYNIWWHGLPSAIRSQVWSLVIGNKLGITKEVFDACLTRSRQNIFQMDQETLKAEHTELANALERKHLITQRFLRTSNCANSCPASAVFPTILSRRAISLRDSPPSFDLSDGCLAANSVSPYQFVSSRNNRVTPKSNQDYHYSSLRVIRLDVSRTFPALGLFQSDGPYHKNLHDLLAAYVSYQPSIGYLQGMSFIAAILLLVLDDLPMAFIAFASIMNRPSFHAFYSLDESEFNAYFGAFDHLLACSLPRLHAHFVACKLDSRLFLFDWLFTIFSRSMPLEANLRVWDLFLRDGESALLLTALGIMRIYEKKLLASDFDELASFLTGPMPTSMSPNALATSMRLLGLRKSIIEKEIDKLRKVNVSSQPSPLSNGNTISRSNSCASSSLSSSSELERSNSQSGSLSLNLEDITDRLSILNDDPPQNEKQQKSSVWSLIGRCGRRSDNFTSPSNHMPLFTRVMFLTRHPSMNEWSKSVVTDYPKTKDL